MPLRLIFLRVIIASIVAMAINSILPYSKFGINLISIFENTTFWWIISAVIIIAFWQAKKYFFDLRNGNNMRIIQWYLIWNMFCIIRGTYLAENYWDWKGLIGNAFVLLLPVVSFIATNKVVVKLILSNYIRFGLPCFGLIVFLIRPEAYGWYLVPLTFLMLFIPILSLRWRIILLLLALLVLPADLGSRSSVIKFGIPLLILFTFYYMRRFTSNVITLARVFLIFLPFLLFFLGVAGIFNLFSMNKFVESTYVAPEEDQSGKVQQTNLMADTRTFLYDEVLNSALKNNYWIIGRTPARGNDTEAFADLAQISGRKERLANEVGILNVFTWTGIIGVIIYFHIFLKSSYLAIYQSKNIYAKMLGLFISFHWLYSWVEDINNFTVNYFMIWIMIGLGFSISFRKMTNKEVEIWARGIFDFRYRKLEYFRNRSVTPLNSIKQT
jgi:hypothetical protein